MSVLISKFIWNSWWGRNGSNLETNWKKWKQDLITTFVSKERMIMKWSTLVVSKTRNPAEKWNVGQINQEFNFIQVCESWECLLKCATNPSAFGIVGNFIATMQGKSEAKYEKHSAFCLETQVSWENVFSYSNSLSFQLWPSYSELSGCHKSS